LGHCPKRNIPLRYRSFRMCTDGKTERYRAALGGASGICHLAVLLVFICSFALVLHAMIHKNLFRRFLVGFYILAFSTLLFGLTRYSYRAKELVVCWLFLCSCFAVLALILFAAMLAAFAGQNFLRWLSVAKLVIPELAAALAEIPQGLASVAPILAFATLKFPVGSCRPVVALDSAPYHPIEAAPLAEEPFSELGVSNCTDSVLRNS
jgi:hypothetical protein